MAQSSDSGSDGTGPQDGQNWQEPMLNMEFI